MNLRAFCLLVALTYSASAQQGAAVARAPSTALPATFSNPVLPSGPDPWVIYHDGYYYYTQTTGKNITLWKSRSIAGLNTAPKKVVWTPPATGPGSHEIWAPELHRIDGKWFLYFAADAGSNLTHRLWVLENDSPDPLEGAWALKGKVSDPTDRWAIDASVFENRGKLYLIWSGWEGEENGTQNIYIAKLKNPWTVDGKRVMLSSPQYPWEKVGDLQAANNPPHVDVNEAPEILQHDGKIFLVYSASGCWTDYQTFGMLTAAAGSNLLRKSSWKKSPLPVLAPSPESHAYGLGQNSFFKSPDGTEDWILYHANPEPKEGCGPRRSPRAQPFTWNADGSPNFGRPAPLGQSLHRPSGEDSSGQ